jgi:Cu2+-containing amine oxidase
MKKIEKSKGVVIYQAKSGAIELRGDFKRQTIWANRMQMAEMFGAGDFQAYSKYL